MIRPEILERIRAMKRASQVVRAGAWRTADAVDRVVLHADERRRRRIVLAGEGGMKFLLDLAEVTGLRDGDGLVLDDGTIVAVIAKPELLVEITAADAAALARLAGTSATATQSSRSQATGCGCGATTYWRTCLRPSARIS